ncbi:Molecular chaperone, DnaJ family protein, partial [Giardia duodenalis]
VCQLQGREMCNCRRASCVDSCPSGGSGSCDKNNVCSCKCSTGTHLDAATNTHSTCNSAFTGPEPDKCTSCVSGKYLKRDASGTTECVGSADCGEGYYADSAANTCSSCGIDKCQTCVSDSGVVKCMKCLSGYLSIDSLSVGPSAISRINRQMPVTNLFANALQGLIWRAVAVSSATQHAWSGSRV